MYGFLIFVSCLVFQSDFIVAQHHVTFKKSRPFEGTPIEILNPLYSDSLSTVQHKRNEQIPKMNINILNPTVHFAESSANPQQLLRPVYSIQDYELRRHQIPVYGLMRPAVYKQMEEINKPVALLEVDGSRTLQELLNPKFDWEDVESYGLDKMGLSKEVFGTNLAEVNVKGVGDDHTKFVIDVSKLKSNGNYQQEFGTIKNDRGNGNTKLVFQNNKATSIVPPNNEGVKLMFSSSHSNSNADKVQLFFDDIHRHVAPLTQMNQDVHSKNPTNKDFIAPEIREIVSNNAQVKHNTKGTYHRVVTNGKDVDVTTLTDGAVLHFGKSVAVIPQNVVEWIMETFSANLTSLLEQKAPTQTVTIHKIVKQQVAVDEDQVDYDLENILPALNKIKKLLTHSSHVIREDFSKIPTNDNNSDVVSIKVVAQNESKLIPTEIKSVSVSEAKVNVSENNSNFFLPIISNNNGQLQTSNTSHKKETSTNHRHDADFIEITEQANQKVSSSIITSNHQIVHADSTQSTTSNVLDIVKQTDGSQNVNSNDFDAENFFEINTNFDQGFQTNVSEVINQTSGNDLSAQTNADIQRIFQNNYMQLNTLTQQGDTRPFTQDVANSAESFYHIFSSSPQTNKVHDSKTVISNSESSSDSLNEENIRTSATRFKIIEGPGVIHFVSIGNYALPRFILSQLEGEIINSTSQGDSFSIRIAKSEENRKKLKEIIEKFEGRNQLVENKRIITIKTNVESELATVLIDKFKNGGASYVEENGFYTFNIPKLKLEEFGILDTDRAKEIIEKLTNKKSIV